MRPLLLQLRGNNALWLILPLTLLDLALLFSRATPWVGDWPETGAAGQVPSFYLSILAAGIAAWISGASVA